MKPRYPIYIISKGRSDSRYTSNALEAMGVDYRIVIEPQEYADYSAVIDPNKILTLPFSNLGQGSIPARNWVWEHSISIGAKRHWIMDDNINGFVRMNRNRKTPCKSGAIFRASEDFVDRYSNVMMAGLDYRFFFPHRTKKPPYRLNTRVYSCILLDNTTITHRWRGQYNEDTDLSLRILKDGWATILFHAFLSNKAGTMTMTGGNTDQLYADDGRLKMAQSLQDQHPDCCSIKWKWGRHHHEVDYSRFRATLLLKRPDCVIGPNKINNYGMRLQTDQESSSTEPLEEVILDHP